MCFAKFTFGIVTVLSFTGLDKLLTGEIQNPQLVNPQVRDNIFPISQSTILFTAMLVKPNLFSEPGRMSGELMS